MKKILVVEDNQELQKGLILNLEMEGYTAVGIDDGEEGIREIHRNAYDLIILDLMLPKLNGIDLLKKVRQENNLTPIIILSAKSEEVDRISTLQLGADDFIAKPFSLFELISRINALFRRIDWCNNGTTIKKGPIKIDSKSCQVFKDDREIKLLPKEYDILKYLFEHANEVISREMLYDAIWGNKFYPEARVIDNHIANLRKKIENDPTDPNIIITIPTKGYKFVTEIV